MSGWYLRFDNMLKKVAVVGLILLLAGTAVLEWTVVGRRKEQREVSLYKLKYGSELKECLKQYDEWLRLPPEERVQVPLEVSKNWKAKTEAQLRQEQQGRLKADLDRLAIDDKDVYPFANVLYGENWQEELRNYKKQKEQNEFIFTGSIVCACAGGAVFIWCLLLWIARLIVRAVSCLWKFVAGIFITQKQAEDKNPAEEGTNENPEQAQQEQKLRKRRKEVAKRSKVLVDSGWQSFGGGFANRSKVPAAQTAVSVGVEGRGRIAAMLSDKEPVSSGASLIRASRENFDTGMTQVNRAGGLRKAGPSDSPKDFRMLEDSLKTQTENLEKQMAEVKQMAQSVQQATLEHSRPLDDTLKELTQQVGAIREYAACQQERVQKLQEGYDWNIIKGFCLRIIRCVDNLESRIAGLSEQDIEMVHLKEVRDELIFLLESSGVERFELEINSDYHGQEKLAEAVKEKEYSYDRSLAGKIAEVIRAGYQYFIDENNFKVVRPAQVKLFG